VTWVAVAIGGSALVGAGASYLGSKKQSDASKSAGNLQMDQFRLINQQQQPFMQSGYGATGRLNTLLGLNPNPNARGSFPMSSPLTQGPGYMPTPGGGVQQIAQMGVPQDRRMFAGGPGGDPRPGSGARLSQLLMVRAANGDREAQALLRGGV
jgi:hypothetical protein